MQGKNDFDAIEEFRGDAFFTRSLDVRTVPSCSTLSQRMDTHSASWFERAAQFNLALQSAKYATGPVDFGTLACGYMALDWDTFVMNNSGTQKEAVGRTYQGADSFTPSAAYLGYLGYGLELLDGKLLLVTNTLEPAAEVAQRYKNLADIVQFQAINIYAT